MLSQWSKFMAFFSLFLGLFGLAKAEDSTKGFLKKTFENADGTKSPYVLFVPHNYDGKTEVPVILFLHGAGESKGGSKQPVEQGIGNHIKGKREKTFPAIVIFPQAEALKKQVVGRWGAGSPDAERALKMLELVQKEYKTDSKRIYLTGLSMGGFGTWSLAAAYPDKWAAIAPICGGGDPKKAEKFKDIPCWAFHGEKDGVVKAQLSRDMIEALRKAGGKPGYTEFAGVDHNSWDPTYKQDEFYEWLFAQKKK
jgi:predicted peptidase